LTYDSQQFNICLSTVNRNGIMASTTVKKLTNVPLPVLRAKTGQEAKEQLQAHGVTLRQFAASKGFDYRTVSEVVRGVNKGLYGEGHKVAVAFGMKKAA
jgi:gp16 family phage-associated protein